MHRNRCMLVTITMLTGLGIDVAAAAEASDGQAYTPIARAADLIKVQAECMADLIKLTQTKPKKRRVWSKIRHRAWGVAEMANLLSLQKDASGELPKRAGTAAQAAAELGKIAKQRQYDTVPGKVKALAETIKAVEKLTANGKIEPTPKAGFKPIAPVIELMELNQEHYDEISELADEGSVNGDAYKTFSHRALLLAETGNLLLLANLDKKDWQQWSREMRDLGKQLTAQAKKKDLPAIQKTIKTMDANCTACHDEYQ